MAVTLEIIVDDLTIGADTVAKVTAKADAVLIDYERILPTNCPIADIQTIAETDLFGENIWVAAPTVTDNRVP